MENDTEPASQRDPPTGTIDVSLPADHPLQSLYELYKFMSMNINSELGGRARQ
jgi:hypothetical protein